MTRCDLRSHGECACEPGQCRVQNLGSFTKAAPVFTFTARDTLIVAATITAFALIVAWMIPAAFERVRLANQEISTWQK